MRARHESTIARRARAPMRGARLLTVSASTLHSSAARDVQHIRSSDGLGATALTADWLSDLFTILHAFESGGLGLRGAARLCVRAKMAGRPPLRIGQRGKITRTYLGGGVWEAQCRYRDTDGVTRRVQRRGPADEHDRHGKLAEDLLIESLADRRPPTDEIGPDTAVMTLVQAHLDRLAEDGRSPATQATYKVVAGKLRANLGGLRIAEANPARIDAVLRAMTNTHGPGMARQAKTILARCPTARGDGECACRQPGPRCCRDQVEATAEGRPVADRRAVARPVGRSARLRLLPQSMTWPTRSPS